MSLPSIDRGEATLVRLMGRPVDRVALLAFLIAVLMLGVNPVGVRFSNRELDPFWGAALRFAASSLVLFAVAAARGTAMPRKRALGAPQCAHA